MNEIESFTENAISKVIAEITDRVFLEVQNNPELMQNYLQMLETKDARSINAEIGKYIRVRLGLTNIGREDSPKSTLIKSYEKHGLPTR